MISRRQSHVLSPAGEAQEPWQEQAYSTTHLQRQPIENASVIISVGACGLTTCPIIRRQQGNLNNLYQELRGDQNHVMFYEGICKKLSRKRHQWPSSVREARTTELNDPEEVAILDIFRSSSINKQIIHI